MEHRVILNDDVWEDVCLGCHKGVEKQVWREFDWKMRTRLFRTLLKCFYTNTNIRNQCWRNCGPEGYQTQIFWD